MSLIEILVVTAIIVLMSAVVMPSISSYFQVSLNSAACDLANTVKETYQATLLTGAIHRMVYDLKGNSFWVESAPSGHFHLLESIEAEKKNQRKRSASKKIFSCNCE